MPPRPRRSGEPGAYHPDLSVVGDEPWSCSAFLPLRSPRWAPSAGDQSAQAEDFDAANDVVIATDSLQRRRSSDTAQPLAVAVLGSMHGAAARFEQSQGAEVRVTSHDVARGQREAGAHAQFAVGGETLTPDRAAPSRGPHSSEPQTSHGSAPWPDPDVSRDAAHAEGPRWALESAVSALPACEPDADMRATAAMVIDLARPPLAGRAAAAGMRLRASRDLDELASRAGYDHDDEAQTSEVNAESDQAQSEDTAAGDGWRRGESTLGPQLETRDESGLRTSDAVGAARGRARRGPSHLPARPPSGAASTMTGHVAARVNIATPGRPSSRPDAANEGSGEANEARAQPPMLAPAALVVQLPQIAADGGDARLRQSLHGGRGSDATPGACPGEQPRRRDATGRPTFCGAGVSARPAFSANARRGALSRVLEPRKACREAATACSRATSHACVDAGSETSIAPAAASDIDPSVRLTTPPWSEGMYHLLWKRYRGLTARQDAASEEERSSQGSAASSTASATTQPGPQAPRTRPASETTAWRLTSAPRAPPAVRPAFITLTQACQSLAAIDLQIAVTAAARSVHRPECGRGARASRSDQTAASAPCDVRRRTPKQSRPPDDATGARSAVRGLGARGRCSGDRGSTACAARHFEIALVHGYCAAAGCGCSGGDGSGARGCRRCSSPCHKRTRCCSRCGRRHVAHRPKRRTPAARR